MVANGPGQHSNAAHLIVLRETQGVLMPEINRARAEMIEVNRAQREFYERVRANDSFKTASSSLASTLWSSVRYRIWDFNQTIGIVDAVSAKFQSRLENIEDLRVLDLGCGSGSALTFWLASNAKEYVGLDLAQYPVDQLNDHFARKNYTNATAVTGDFLEQSLPAEHFDVIYAAAVLHHFRDTAVLRDELMRVLKPGGLVLSYDPLATEPLNRVARKVYRRWQDDSDWEWPFTRDRVEMLVSGFEPEHCRGYLGFSKYAIPLFLIPGLRGLALKAAKQGAQLDDKRATCLNRTFFNCWHFSMILRKPGA